MSSVQQGIEIGEKLLCNELMKPATSFSFHDPIKWMVSLFILLWRFEEGLEGKGGGGLIRSHSISQFSFKMKKQIVKMGQVTTPEIVINLPFTVISVQRLAKSYTTYGKTFYYFYIRILLWVTLKADFKCRFPD